MPDGQDGQVIYLIRRERGQHPGQGGAPVVSDHMSAAHLLGGQHGLHVSGQKSQRIGLDGTGLAGSPVPAQVRDDDLKSGGGQGWNLMPPQPPGVGETVQQHNRASLTRDLILDADPVDIYPAHPPTPIRGSCHLRCAVGHQGSQEAETGAGATGT